jgi:AcrR family transcriptional regulator
MSNRTSGGHFKREFDTKFENLHVSSHFPCHLPELWPAVMWVVSRDVTAGLSQTRVIFFKLLRPRLLATVDSDQVSSLNASRDRGEDYDMLGRFDREKYAACVATSSVGNRARLSRRRHSPHPSGDDRERAILATAERLLDERALADISVDDLAKGAGISRPTFYFYFPSKEAVLLALLERMVAEADTAWASFVEHSVEDHGEQRANMWRAGIKFFFETFGQSRKGVTRAGWSARTTNLDIRQLWSAFMQKCISYTVTVIEAERARGFAPVTLPARELATALNMTNEWILYASFADEQPCVPEAHVLDTLTYIWVTSIYAAPI